ncbi:MAG: type II toxin-antitoxin system RelE/ParE family toxin [Methanomicrobia archaeon]|nr:type II toxin-antitoxin system RelE/ParE family toxin [Methanomicrobia archaeon]MCK4432827.1 type II toxin-antitoxin system RelE/ParE family toxin [Methanomicrobia archaeon]
MYKIFLSKETVRFLLSLDKENEKVIRDKIKKLSESPESFGKHLKGIDLWSLRIGKYRVLFEINKEKEEVFIVTMGHRKDVYHKLKEK